MQKVTRKVDALGFDKWQIADIRRANSSNKSTYTKLNKLAEKIQKLGADYKALEQELAAWEGPVKLITQKVLGLELNSQEVLAYHANPALFMERFPEHPLCETIPAWIAEHEEEMKSLTLPPVVDVAAPEGSVEPFDAIPGPGYVAETTQEPVESDSAF